MVKPWIEAGHEAVLVDLQHPIGCKCDGNVLKIGVDVLNFHPTGHYDAVFAFPPCTDLAVSGARWFQGKGLRRLSEAILVFARCVEIIEQTGAPGFCENPVSTISSYFRPPDYSFNPCDYGDPYTKRTCLWAFNGFTLPPVNRVHPSEGSKMHLIGPSDERANLRSETPMGFARAVFRHMTDPVQPMLLEAA
jgi:hypothetical protein